MAKQTETQADRIEFLESSLAEMSGQIGELTGQVSELLKRNELLAKQVDTPRNQRAQEQAALEARRERREQEQKKLIEQLEAGENKYRVYLAKEPIWGCTVGGSSEREAEMKFREHSGIRGTSADNPVVVEAIEPVEA